MRGMSRFLSPLSRGREGSAHEAIWLEGERAGNTGPGGEGREMRESGSGGVMERLGPRRDAQGGRGTKSGRSAEAPGGNGRAAGPCVCAAEQRAAFQLRAPRAASRSWHPGARLPGGGGARGKVTFAQSACAEARWGCGEGGALLGARGR